MNAADGGSLVLRSIVEQTVVCWGRSVKLLARGWFEKRQHRGSAFRDACSPVPSQNSFTSSCGHTTLGKEHQVQPFAEVISAARDLEFRIGADPFNLSTHLLGAELELRADPLDLGANLLDLGAAGCYDSVLGEPAVEVGQIGKIQQRLTERF
jgi:hypothetical protein